MIFISGQCKNATQTQRDISLPQWGILCVFQCPSGN